MHKPSTVSKAIIWTWNWIKKEKKKQHNTKIKSESAICFCHRALPHLDKSSIENEVLRRPCQLSISFNYRTEKRLHDSDQITATQTTTITKISNNNTANNRGTFHILQSVQKAQWWELSKRELIWLETETKHIYIVCGGGGRWTDDNSTTLLHNSDIFQRLANGRSGTTTTTKMTRTTTNNKNNKKKA